VDSLNAVHDPPDNNVRVVLGALVRKGKGVAEGAAKRRGGGGGRRARCHGGAKRRQRRAERRRELAWR
jgi:hypothetical protein